MRSC